MKTFITFLWVLYSLAVFSQQKHNDGPYKQHYENGQLKLEGYYKNNNKTGIWKEYYEDGQLSDEYTFKNNGTSTGNRKSYSKKGVLINESKKLNTGDAITTGYYDSGKLWHATMTNDKESNYKEYYESEKIKIESNYINGEINGVWQRFFETGQLEWEVAYYNGYKQGSYKQYSNQGKLMLEGNHLVNQKNGEEKRYDSNGNLEWSGDYLKNDFDGEWKQFDSLGNIINTLKYKNGKLKKSNDNVILDPITIPDGHFEHVPMYPGCENALGFKEQKKCMSVNISQFVNKKFNTSLAKELGLAGMQRINVIFKIDTTGNIIDARARAPHPELEKEAIRVVNSLPKMTPGNQRGKNVVVPYSLPINFSIPEKSTKKSSFDDPFFNKN